MFTRLFARLTLIAVLTVAIVGCATTPERPPLVEDPDSHPWREDLAIFATVLEQEHADLFFQLPREEFAEMITELSARAPDLSAIEFDLELRRILAATGLIRSPERAEFTFRDEQGATFTVPVEAVGQERVREIESLKNRLREVGAPQPLSRQHNDRAYWYTSKDDRGLIYVQYNVCREDPERPMSAFAESVLSRIDADIPSQVVIDLRRNSGGDSRVLQPLIDGLIARHRRGASYRLSVIIGRDTFSSAVLNAIALKQEAGAIFVGEPSGGRPNHYGEIQTFELPHLQRTVQYSTTYFHHYQPADGSNPPALLPDRAAPPSFPAYVQGRDPAMEALGLGISTP